jgi:Methylamine utilisation protein MauE
MSISMLAGILVARLLLAVVFAIAGGAKLVDPTGSRDSLRQFGVDGWLVGVFARCLPIAELGVAVGLLANASARWAGAGALVLLGVFAAGIGLNLVRGKHPDCHCFGHVFGTPRMVHAGTQWRAGRRGRRDRLAGPGLDAGLWMAGLTPLVWVSAVVVVVLIGLIVVEGWFLLNLTSQQGRLLLRLEALEDSIRTQAAASGAANGSHAGLAIGSRAPDFELPRLTGGSVTLRALLEASRPLLLVFSTSFSSAVVTSRSIAKRPVNTG